MSSRFSYRFPIPLLFLLSSLSFRDPMPFPDSSSFRFPQSFPDPQAAGNTIDAPAFNLQHTNDLTVSYSIEILSRKKNTGKAQAYSGGIQTIFISDKGTRSRLVSLMRIQSIFVLPGDDPARTAVLLKESGKNKYKYYLDAGEWALYNQKYAGATCRNTGETMTLLNYSCQKAVITLKKGSAITVYYTDAVKNPGLPSAEPAFACVPGLVLRYEYSYKKKGTIVYTATRIDRGRIDAGVFRIPSEGYQVTRPPLTSE